MDVLTIVRRSPFVFPLACLAAVAMVFISEGTYWQSVTALNRLGDVNGNYVNLRVLGQAVLDAESGQRGYLITNRPEYLVPYRRARRDIEVSLAHLRASYADEPKSLAVLSQLHGLTDAKLEELAQTIQLHDLGRGEAATQLVLSDIGKQKMEAIRALSAQLLQDANTDRIEHRSALYQTLQLSRIGLATLTAISLLALFIYLRQAAAFKAHELELRRQVQAERDRLEVEVAQRTTDLVELTRHLQGARENERQRLARNLHDDLGALLTSAKLDAARIKSRLGPNAPEALERLAHLVDTLNASIALGRSIIEDLHPSTLVNLGLVPTLEILAREFGNRGSARMHCTLAAVNLSRTAQLAVYRLVQEAFTNISKYAQAQQVWLSMGCIAGVVEVSVRDDGVGFDSGGASRSAYGLLGMRYRVEAEGGQLAVISRPGQGTLVRMTIPQASAADSAMAALE